MIFAAATDGRFGIVEQWIAPPWALGVASAAFRLRTAVRWVESFVCSDVNPESCVCSTSSSFSVKARASWRKADSSMAGMAGMAGADDALPLGVGAGPGLAPPLASDPSIASAAELGLAVGETQSPCLTRNESEVNPEPAA